MTEDLEAGDIVWLKSGAKSCTSDLKEGGTGTPKMTIEIISGIMLERKASCIWWDGLEFKRGDFYISSLTRVPNGSKQA